MGIELGGSIKFKVEEDISLKLEELFFAKEYNPEFHMSLECQ